MKDVRMTRRALFPLLLASVLACPRDAAPGLAATDLLGNDEGGPFNHALSPDGSRLAWAQSTEGKAAIFVGHADGTSRVRLTHGNWDHWPVWSPDGRWIAYMAEGHDNDLFVAPSDGGEPRQLTAGQAIDRPVAWLRDGSGVVVYRSGLGADQTLVVPLDGGTPRSIVPALGGNQYVAISPDGSKAVFDLHRGGESTIWVQDLSGGSARQLTTEGFESFEPAQGAWAPDGRHVVYVSRRTGTSDLWIADVETGDLRQLTHDVHNDGNHAWSPDGRWIAFSSDRGGQTDVWIMPAAGGAAVRVSNDLAYEDLIQWAPDGTGLFYARWLVHGGVGVASVDGGEPRILVDWPGHNVVFASVTLSPDERTVLFAGDRSGNNDIWSVPLAGGEPTPFVAGPLNDVWPRFSPDGSQVLFVSNRSRSADIWIMPVTGGEAHQLTNWPSDEYVPTWSPDGSQVAFVSNHDNTQEDVWVVPSTGGVPRRISNFRRDIILGDKGIAWSPDGKSIYAVVVAANGVRELYQIPLSGATPRKLDTSPNATEGALSPDGSQVAYYEYKDAWGFTEVTPTAGGPHRRLTRRTDFVFQTSPLWSPDGTRLAVSDWDFTDATSDVLEMGVLDTLRRRLTHIPHSFEEPRAYTADGRSVLFAMQGSDWRVMAVRVGDLLARASASRP
jgi:Tol biopolymer transport system component